MTKIKKAVIPVAGFGTRFLPAAKAIPKTLFPLIDKPIIDYLIEEALAAGIEEIVFVISPRQKKQKILQNYLQKDPELEKILLKKGKKEILKKIHTLENTAKFHFVVQNQALGDGHAILCAEKIVKNEPFLVLFGDDLVDPPIAKNLVSLFAKKKSSVISLLKIPQEMTRQCGIVQAKNYDQELIEIVDLVEKPEPKDAPSDLGIIGKYICTPDIFPILKKFPKSADGECRLIDAFKILLKTKPIFGYKIKGKRYDIGSKIGFLKATIDFALKNPEIKNHPEFQKFFKT